MRVMENIELLRLLAVVGFVSLFAAFLVLLAHKVGLVEWMQVHGSDLVSKMAHCDFCMSWWCCVLLTVMVMAVTGEVYLAAVPFIATPLTRYWL